MDKYYHLFSSPLSGPLFVNDDDRRYFLNRIALCHISKIFKTYVYCLMNNHIHLLVSGDEDRIKEAFNDIKRLYHRYLNSREEAIKVKLEEFSVSTRLINNLEDFKIVVAYILRNRLSQELTVQVIINGVRLFCISTRGLAGSRESPQKNMGSETLEI